MQGAIEPTVTPGTRIDQYQSEDSKSSGSRKIIVKQGIEGSLEMVKAT